MRATAREETVWTRHRRHPRAEVDLAVLCRTEDAAYRDFARMLGAGGMFVETENAPPVGSQVSMEFELPGLAGPIEIGAQVVWTRGALESGPSGMGLQFCDVERQLEEAIAAYVDRQRAAQTAA